MKATIFAVAAFCTSLATATPLDKRAWATAYELVTVTVTVAGSLDSLPVETAAAAAQALPSAEVSSWSDWNSGSGSGSGFGSGSGSWWGAWRGWGSNGNSAVASTAWQTQSAVATITHTPSTSAIIPTYSAPSSVLSSAISSIPVVSSSSVPGVVSSLSTSSSLTPTTSTPASVPTSVSSDYQQGILDSHNIHRQNASVSGLVWSDQMASIAAQIASSCVYAHDTSAGGGGYGQNIGAGAPPDDIPAMITNQMYNGEINYYPAYGVEPDMSNFEKWGHYSQIVWKSTTSVGCATQYCPNGLANVGSGVSPYFTVCNYSPPGMSLSLTTLC